MKKIILATILSLGTLMSSQTQAATSWGTCNAKGLITWVYSGGGAVATVINGKICVINSVDIPTTASSITSVLLEGMSTGQAVQISVTPTYAVAQIGSPT